MIYFVSHFRVFHYGFLSIEIFVHTGQTNKTDRLDFTIRLHVCLLRHNHTTHSSMSKYNRTQSKGTNTHAHTNSPCISFPEVHVRYGVCIICLMAIKFAVCNCSSISVVKSKYMRTSIKFWEVQVFSHSQFLIGNSYFTLKSDLFTDCLIVCQQMIE